MVFAVPNMITIQEMPDEVQQTPFTADGGRIRDGNLVKESNFPHGKIEIFYSHPYI